MNDRPKPDPALARFLVIQLSRIGGVVMVLFGIAIVLGRFDLPVAAGYGLLAMGLFESFALPLILSRRWRSPDQ
jgi:hypothetical protein